MNPRYEASKTSNSMLNISHSRLLDINANKSQQTLGSKKIQSGMKMVEASYMFYEFIATLIYIFPTIILISHGERITIRKEV